MLALPCALAGAPVLTACSSTPEAADAPLPPSSAPSDFSLALTVYAPASAHNNPRVPAWRRPARYVIQTDQVLRAAVGPGVSQDLLPPQTRQLQPAQVERLWADVRDGGLLAADHAGRVPTLAGFEPIPKATTLVVSVTGAGERRTLVLGADDGAGRRVAERLAQYAWVSP